VLPALSIPGAEGDVAIFERLEPIGSWHGSLQAVVNARVLLVPASAGNACATGAQTPESIAEGHSGNYEVPGDGLFNLQITNRIFDFFLFISQRQQTAAGSNNAAAAPTARISPVALSD
jgi:hypothetical protein